MNMCWLSKISDGRLGVANVVMHGRRLLATAAAIFLSFFFLFIYLFIIIFLWKLILFSEAVNSFFCVFVSVSSFIY